MSLEVKIPSVGESITSGVIAAWHKQDGEIVRANDPLLTLETDKVSSEIVAAGTGQLKIQAKEGEEVKIGQVVATIDESVAAPAAAAETVPAPNKTAPSPDSTPQTSVAAKTENLTASAPAQSDQPLSPSVRRIVDEEKVAAGKVSGTGKGGRLTKGDVLAHVADRDSKAADVAPAAVENTISSAMPKSNNGDRTTRKKLSPLRRKIAAQLVMAQQTAAILTTFNECDMTGVMSLRTKIQDNFTKKYGVKLGFMSFFIKAAVEALKAVPSLNGRLEGDEFIQNHYYDIGVAVGTEKGLIVPVLRDCDSKDFAQLEKDIAGYAGKARDGKISIDDLTGGVFTISNGGTYGSLLSTPILNPPQSGILGMHNIVQRPIAMNGQVVIRPMMYLALSYDHRVVDGKEAVTALVRIKDCIEEPSRLFLGL